MKNKIDQFFKDKLEGHTLPPSGEAWAKVEASLSKKNNIAIWRIAAALLIAGTLITVMIWSERGDNQEQAVVANHLPKDNSKKEIRTPQNTSKAKKEASRPAKKVWVKPQEQPLTPGNDQAHNSAVTAENTLVEKKPVATEASTVVVEKNKIEESSKLEATAQTTFASTHQKSIKLEFTLEDFPSAPPVATVGEEKSSGLKKVWELAREVKNGDGPVREIKNELFALNFKKNKNQ